MKLINFDANATYGCLPEVIEGVRELVGSGYLNPSSIHQGGQKAKGLIEEARDSVKRLIGAASKDTVIFTSGASEANNWVFAETSLRASRCGISNPEAITTPTEHPSILEAAPRYGVSLSKISPHQITKDLVTPNTQLVTIMLANNETGHVNPVRKIFDELRDVAKNTLFHSDCVQALGKMNFAFSDLSADLISISGHKIGALSGVGALVVREGIVLSPFIAGGPQEKRQRAGTENTLGIVSFGIAAKVVFQSLKERLSQFKIFKSAFEREILSLNSRLGYDAISVLNENTDHLTNTFSLRIRGIRADDLVVALDLEGLAVSSGAACSSGKPDPSHVLLGLGYSEEIARETIRVSFKASYLDNEFQKGLSIFTNTLEKALYGRKAA